MGLSKTEVNLRRLLAAAPQQPNQSKLWHYVATLREQLEQLAEERTPEGLPRISKVQLNEYSKTIETIAAKLVVPEPSAQPSDEPEVTESPSKSGESNQSSEGGGLRRRSTLPLKDRPQSAVEDSSTSKSVKLDAESKARIDKRNRMIKSFFLCLRIEQQKRKIFSFRKLQDDLTDEMVVLARQLKERSVMMNQSIQNTEKILDSTEKAVEHSLATTGHANSRTMDIYSQSMKTTCFTWLLMFAMTCIFIMVVLLIRVT